MAGSGSVIDWLLDSDPSIRWQVMRDLLDAPEPKWRAERAKVETEGWGREPGSCRTRTRTGNGRVAHSCRDFDAREWQEVGQPWTATTFALSQLRELGLDPASDRARRAVELIGANARWAHAGQPYWEVVGTVRACGPAAPRPEERPGGSHDSGCPRAGNPPEAHMLDRPRVVGMSESASKRA